MEAIGKDRTISFDPCEKFYGKNTCNLPARIKIPVIINAEGTITGPNDFMTKIVNTYQTYQENRQNCPPNMKVLWKLSRNR